MAASFAFGAAFGVVWLCIYATYHNAIWGQWVRGLLSPNAIELRELEMALVSRFSTVAMRFTRFQTALLCVALTLAAVALSRVMTVELEALKAAVLGESPPVP